MCIRVEWETVVGSVIYGKRSMWVWDSSCEKGCHQLLSNERNVLLGISKGSPLNVIQNGGKVKDTTVIAICLLRRSGGVDLECPKIRVPKGGGSFNREEILVEKVKTFLLHPAFDIVEHS